MRKRNNRIQVWMDDTEKSMLEQKAAACGLKREAYLRRLVTGFAPKVLPPVDYHSMMRLLFSIANSMNQLARKAHQFGDIDKAAYQAELEKLHAAILKIEEAVLEPERMEEP